MSTNGVLDFAVTDLLGGGDDVQRLVATDDPDGLWDEVIRWSRHRLTAALLAAVGIIPAKTRPRQPVATATTHWRPATVRPVTT